MAAMTIGVERIAVAGAPVAIAAAGIATCTAGAVNLPGALGAGAALAVAVAVTAVAAPRLARRLPTDLAGAARRHPVRAAAWALLAVLAVGNTARVGLFMADSSRLWASMFPPVPDSAEHECLPAYVRAAELAAAGADNVYDDARYEQGASDTRVEGLAPRLGDPFEYPPPFLVLPSAALAVTQSYPTLRAAWYGVQVVALAAVFVLVALWVGGRAGARALVLFPAVALSFPTVINLQFGQFQLAAVVCAVAGALALSRGHYAAGGALLGFATASKIFPGLLLVYYAARRDLRAIAWTAAGVAVWSVAGALVVGLDPFVDFVGYQLPRLASGEAVAGTIGNPDNFSLFSLYYKLDALGVPGMSRSVGVALAWLWTIVALALAAVAGARSRGADPGRQAVLWLAVLALGALRSPFAPMYTAVIHLWLLALLAGTARPSRATTALIIASFVLFQGFPPVFGDAVNALLSFPAQLLALAVPIAVTVKQP